MIFFMMISASQDIARKSLIVIVLEGNNRIQ
jgi:hypothetical protein